MALVEILDEQEVKEGWSFTAQVLDGAGDVSRLKVRLSWADYNLWSPNGADPPADVVGAAIEFLLERVSLDELPASFDASIARRRCMDADDGIPVLITRGR